MSFDTIFSHVVFALFHNHRIPLKVHAEASELVESPSYLYNVFYLKVSDTLSSLTLYTLKCSKHRRYRVMHGIGNNKHINHEKRVIP